MLLVSFSLRFTAHYEGWRIWATKAPMYIIMLILLLRLHTAEGQRRVICMRELLSRGGNASVQDWDSRTPLHWACGRGM